MAERSGEQSPQTSKSSGCTHSNETKRKILKSASTKCASVLLHTHKHTHTHTHLNTQRNINMTFCFVNVNSVPQFVFSFETQCHRHVAGYFLKLRRLKRQLKCRRIICGARKQHENCKRGIALDVWGCPFETFRCVHHRKSLLVDLFSRVSVPFLPRSDTDSTFAFVFNRILLRMFQLHIVQISAGSFVCWREVVLDTMCSCDGKKMGK